MKKLVYCKYCGTQHIELGNGICIQCNRKNALVCSNNESKYYGDKAIELYNDIIKFDQVLFDEEISKNPDFDPNLKDELDFQREKRLRAHKNEEQNQNIPKCPTCGSINIKKISTTSKIAGAAMFGLLSKTARSQFCCNSCGYKW